MEVSKSEVSRFDLEQYLLDCWKITDDINLLNEFVLERDFNTDQISNTLLGLHTLYTMKFEKAWECFEKLTEQRKID